MTEDLKRGAFWSELQFLTGLADRLNKANLTTLPAVHFMSRTIYVKFSVWGPDEWDLRAKGASPEEIPVLKREAIEAEFAKIVDLFPGAEWEKNDPTDGKYGDTYYELKGVWEKVIVEAVTYRKDVCEAVVVLEHDVISEVPDPEFLKDVPLVKVTEKKQVIEWQCNSVIAEKTAPVLTSKKEVTV